MDFHERRKAWLCWHGGRNVSAFITAIPGRVRLGDSVLLLRAGVYIINTEVLEILGWTVSVNVVQRNLELCRQRAIIPCSKLSSLFM